VRNKWISATFLPALLGLGDHRVTAQKASEMVSLEFSGFAVRRSPFPLLLVGLQFRIPCCQKKFFC
jgi:hypothetical protein